MREKPIIFSAPIIKAILGKRCTMTRRIIKPQPPIDSFWDKASRLFCLPGSRLGLIRNCPYGQAGDRLWLKETHYRWGHWAKNGFSKTGKQKWTFKALNREVAYTDFPPSLIHDNRSREINGWFKRPSIFMPRWASRITLEITEVRVKRLQSISPRDACAEGVGDYGRSTPQIQFAKLWDSINAKRGYGWETNPWVWVVSFKLGA